MSGYIRCTDRIAPIRHPNKSRTDQIDNIWAHSRRREVFWLLVGSSFRNSARWYHIWSAWLPLQPTKNIKKNAKQKPLFPKQSKPPQEPIILHHCPLFCIWMGRRGCWAWHAVTFHACGSVGRTRRSTTSTYAGNFYRSNRPLTSTQTIHGYIVSRYIVRRESSQRHSNVSMTIRHGWWGKRPQRTPHIRVQFLAKNEPKQMPSGTKPRLVTQ